MAETSSSPTTDAPVAGTVQEKKGSEWSRKYPPLVTILVALVLAIAVLPSALNLPQTNPTQTLEYAPVPPEDNEEPPPADGNLSSLGLGSSSGVAADAEGGEGPGDGTLPPLPGGKGANPSTKRCVGNPPRQTEDPVAPPCVAFFDGDNFGNTYQGVTKDEVRLLVYIDSFIAETGGSKGREVRPENEFFDLFEPPKDDEHLLVEGYRGWQRYFNERFQTYGRTVHFILHFGSVSKSPEARRADAAEGYARVKPFAVLTDANENEVDYVEAMAKRGVLNFGSFYGKESSFFNRFPKLVWGYQPTLEYSAETYSSFVCRKVVGKNAVLAGGELANRPRKLGLFHTTDENFPGLIRLAELVQQKVEACGGEIAATATFPVCCFAQDNGTTPDYAATNMAEFRQQGITTILWTGGVEGYTGQAAASQGYQPEWIVLGDGTLDGNNPVRLSKNSAAFDGRGIVVTPEVFEPGIEQQRCYQAFREVNQTRPKSDLGFICGAYRNLFQLFTGIQVAGPRLGPTSVDRGYHAIPPVRSDDPTSPACFYNSADYTCVKDAQFEIWNADGQAPGDNRPGCWMIINGAKRFLPGEWPEGNIDAQGPGQRCNGRSATVLINPT
jgi:hypothetical protein